MKLLRGADQSRVLRKAAKKNAGAAEITLLQRKKGGEWVKYGGVSLVRGKCVDMWEFQAQVNERNTGVDSKTPVRGKCVCIYHFELHH